MNISAIKIGDRARKDMGDIKGLAESIREHGMLHPIVVLEDGTLVAGGRRLAAAGMLGMEEVPVTVVNVTDLLSAERDENAIRKDLTPTEAVALGRLIESEHRKRIAPAVRARRVLAGLKARGVEPEVGSRTARGTEITPDLANVTAAVESERPDRLAAESVGMAPGTYYRAKSVVEAAEREPEKYGDLPEKMDETGNVTGVHDELRRRKAGQSSRSDVHYRAQYPKPNREMERGLIALDGLVTGFGLIELDGLDRSKTAEWATSLDRAAASLKKIARKVRGL